MGCARLGSAANGPIVPVLAQKYGVSMAFYSSFFLNALGFIFVILIVLIDRWAESKDGIRKEVKDEEKFKFSDIKKLNYLPYWLLLLSTIPFYLTTA